ncbi:hypothetical protein RRG08_033366 [Elysia crispata]|uniref:Groucho/TLE N-terminal Q-rich domain-containing protein n=1 Tax=Elysia crispata TaxID=231223 RepID=A0AAE0Z7H1_9GAST|nr:hypothetical protein RRG08_033366 [Elysia crispata]
MSYGLNVEMHKQSEIVKRLNAICAQVIPFLSQEHQQQVAAAVERAKQVTMQELNAIIGSVQVILPASLFTSTSYANCFKSETLSLSNILRTQSFQRVKSWCTNVSESHLKQRILLNHFRPGKQYWFEYYCLCPDY